MIFKEISSRLVSDLEFS